LDQAFAAAKPRHRRDCDNLPKGGPGFIVRPQVIEDDAKVTSVTQTWDSTVPAGVVLVTVEPRNGTAGVVGGGFVVRCWGEAAICRAGDGRMVP
jgi:hypothetical protein